MDTGLDHIIYFKRNSDKEVLNFLFGLHKKLQYAAGCDLPFFKGFELKGDLAVRSDAAFNKIFPNDSSVISSYTMFGSLLLVKLYITEVPHICMTFYGEDDLTKFGLSVGGAGDFDAVVDYNGFSFGDPVALYVSAKMLFLDGFRKSCLNLRSKVLFRDGDFNGGSEPTFYNSFGKMFSGVFYGEVIRGRFNDGVDFRELSDFVKCVDGEIISLFGRDVYCSYISEAGFVFDDWIASAS